MAAAQRGEPEGVVLARVLVVADADERLVEEPHHRGEDLPARQIAGAQVALHPLADVRQDLAELEHAAELRLIALRPVPRMVPVLLASPRIARRRLDVTVRVGT